MLGASTETWLPVAPPKASTETGTLAADGAAGRPPRVPAPRSASAVAPDAPVPDRRRWTGPVPRLAVQTVDPRPCALGAGQYQASERGAVVAEAVTGVPAATGVPAVFDGTMPSSAQEPPMIRTMTSTPPTMTQTIRIHSPE